MCISEKMRNPTVSIHGIMDPSSYSMPKPPNVMIDARNERTRSVHLNRCKIPPFQCGSPTPLEVNDFTHLSKVKIRIDTDSVMNLASMSDWEPAARNAMKKALPQLEIDGCWFHFTQRIWAKTQKVGLAQDFRNRQEIESYIKQLMALPFLPASLINPTYTYLQIPNLSNSDMIKLQKLKKYFKKRWLSQIEPGELSVYNLDISTNNAAGSYHSKLKSLVRSCHPRVWTFMATQNQIIQDTDNDIGRLQLALEISRPRKKFRTLNVKG